MVSIHRWNVDDHYYLHYYRDAKKLFDEIKQKEEDASVTIGLKDNKNPILSAMAGWDERRKI